MLYTDEQLDRLRLSGDPIPDQLIAELNGEQRIEEVNRVLHQLIKNNQVIPAELPDNLEFWLRNQWRLPQWADRARIERGSQFFVEYGVPICLILPTAALIECYAARKGVKALATTYRLGQTPYRRVAETAQFVLNVLSPGGLEAEGRGIPTILKIRLMHSAIRLLMRKQNTWDEAEYGVPLCQEDMLGSLLAFSHSIVGYLRKLGIEVREAEAEDYYYTWRVIGVMLGLPLEIIPSNLSEAGELSALIKRRQHGPSADGVRMTKAILEMFADLIPGTLFDGVVPAVIRRLVGEQVADWMEVPHTHWESFITQHDKTIIRALDVLDHKAGVLADSIDRLGLAFLSRTAIAATGYERVGFDIPDELRTAWQKNGKVI